MKCNQLLNDIRNVSKWLNEESLSPIDRNALARILASVAPANCIVLNRQDLLLINQKLTENPDVDPFKITTIDSSSTYYSVLISNMKGDIL